ncbi:MAG: divergent polysaccharide deacetylase family protein [Proteobacteria bacterium]|nr:divergent polysaccharide deacetylase family protein [Pseudomonadota bacterium]
MAKRSKKPAQRSRGRRWVPGGWGLILTAGALLLGGLGVGLFIGTQLRPSPSPRAAATARIVPAPPTPTTRDSAPAPAPEAPHPSTPPEHNPEAAEDVPGLAPAPAPTRKPEAAPRSQLAAMLVPKPPAFAGAPPWRVNAVAAPPTLGYSMIVLVIDDMGLDRRRSSRAIGLPGPLTLSFLPYADDLPGQAALAHRHGHELLVHVPMEPLGSANNPGPNPLTTALAGDELVSRLRRDLARFDGFVGINNHMGSKFTSFGPGMAMVMAELRTRGLLWLDSRTTGNSVGTAMAREYEVPHVVRDIFLDNTPTVAAVQRQLAELEALARRRGWAVAIGHPKDSTLDALAAWLPTLSDRRLVLVPLTHIVREVPAGAG